MWKGVTIMQGRSTFRTQIVLEIFYTIVTIGLLLAAAHKEFLPLLKQTEAVMISSRFAGPHLDAMLNHAISGTWDTPLRQSTGISGEQLPTYENGAFHITFTGTVHSSANETITIRPVTPVEDDLGPVIWVVGNSTRKTVYGEDRTTFPERFIQPTLK